MTDLFEVVFEGVNKDCAIQFLLRLISGAEHIISVECTEKFELMKDRQLNEKILESVLNFNGDVSVLIKLRDMKVGNTTLPAVLLRLVKYGNQLDVDFNFDANEHKNMDVALLMKHLHCYAKEMAEDIKVENFFGGMEPASDKNTRYFTNQNVGPLS